MRFQEEDGQGLQERDDMAKKEYTTINRGNENFLVIIGAVNGSPSKDKE